jgi:hypothetical protein
VIRAGIPSTSVGASPQSFPTVLFSAFFQPMRVFSASPVAVTRIRHGVFANDPSIAVTEIALHPA